MVDARSCQSCGACCEAIRWGDGVSCGQRPFVTLQRLDLIQLEFMPASLTRWVPAEIRNEVGETALPQNRTGLALAITPRGRCVALRGWVGRGVTCGIYDQRPITCRAFEPGGSTCLEIRRRAGMDRPLVQEDVKDG